MAIINPDVTAAKAGKRALQDAGTWGKVIQPIFDYTLAAVAQNEHVVVGIIPAGSRVQDFVYEIAALGATTGLEFGYLEVDDLNVNDVNFFATVADTSGATGVTHALLDQRFENAVYIVLKQTGAGSASGLVKVRPAYVYEGGK